MERNVNNTSVYGKEMAPVQKRADQLSYVRHFVRLPALCKRPPDASLGNPRAQEAS
jgi:hypothetical protein